MGGRVSLPTSVAEEGNSFRGVCVFVSLLAGSVRLKIEEEVLPSSSGLFSPPEDGEDTTDSEESPGEDSTAGSVVFESFAQDAKTEINRTSIKSSDSVFFICVFLSEIKGFPSDDEGDTSIVPLNCEFFKYRMSTCADDLSINSINSIHLSEYPIHSEILKEFPANWQTGKPPNLRTLKPIFGKFGVFEELLSEK